MPLISRKRLKRTKVTVATTHGLPCEVTPERLAHIPPEAQLVERKPYRAVKLSFDVHYSRGHIDYMQWLAGTRLLHLHAAVMSKSAHARTPLEFVDASPQDGPQFSATYKADMYYNVAFATPLTQRVAFTWLCSLNVEDKSITTLGELYGAGNYNACTAVGFLALRQLLNFLALYWGYSVSPASADAAFVKAIKKTLDTS